MNTLLTRYHALPSRQRTAVLIVIGLILYLILANVIGSGKNVNNDTIALTSDKPLSELVRIEEMTATEKPIFLSLYGFTEANRQVGLRAQVEGMVETIEASEGSAVAAGDVIVKIEERDRAARVAQAKALLTQREVEYEAARKLRKTGAESKVRLVKTKARPGSRPGRIESRRSGLSKYQDLCTLCRHGGRNQRRSGGVSR